MSAPAVPLVGSSLTADGWKSLDTEHPTYVIAFAEGVDIDPRRFVPGAADASVLPVPRLFTDVTALAGYAATRSDDLVDQLRMMVDAIRADGGLRISPEAMVRSHATGKAILDAIACFGLSPTPSATPGVVPHVPVT